MSNNSSPFVSFSFTVNDDVYVTPVGNSEYLPVGIHDVRIESVEFDNSQYGPQLKVKLIDEKGATFTDYVSIIAKNKEGETGVKPGYKFLMLGQSLIADPSARVAFISRMIPTNPHLADCIKNTRVQVEIVEPTKGYTIHDVSGQKMILDLELNSYVQDDSGIELAFASFDEAKSYMEAAGLKRAYNKLNKYKPMSAEQQAANQAIMQPALDPFMGKAQTKTSTLPQRKAVPGRPSV